MTSHSVWKPRFWLQITFAEQMSDTENISHSDGIVNVKSEGGLPPPLSVINFLSKPYFGLSDVKSSRIMISASPFVFGHTPI